MHDSRVLEVLRGGVGCHGESKPTKFDGDVRLPHKIKVFWQNIHVRDLQTMNVVETNQNLLEIADESVGLNFIPLLEALYIIASAPVVLRYDVGVGFLRVEVSFVVLQETHVF